MLVGARRWGNGLAQQTVLHHFRGRAKPRPDGKTWPDRRIRVQKVVEIRHALRAEPRATRSFGSWVSSDAPDHAQRDARERSRHRIPTVAQEYTAKSTRLSIEKSCALMGEGVVCSRPLS